MSIIWIEQVNAKNGTATEEVVKEQVKALTSFVLCTKLVSILL
jgi:hypothetical protein